MSKRRPKPPAPIPTPPLPLVPSLGVYVCRDPADLAPQAAWEQMVGAQAGIVHWYQRWGDVGGWTSGVFSAAPIAACVARGSTPLITWEARGVSLRDILAGSYDPYIDAWATGLRDTHTPVYLRLFHEMNTAAYSWGYGVDGNTAADLIAAWRYVRARFVAASAINVRWVWCPNTVNDRVSLELLYPGAAHVDVMGVDGYNGGSQLPWGGWRTPEQVFGDTLRTFARIAPDNPVMICETSSVEEGGDKAAWIRDLFALPLSYPTLHGICWFEYDLSAYGQADWRVNTSPQVLAAFRAR